MSHYLKSVCCLLVIACTVLVFENSYTHAAPVSVEGMPALVVLPLRSSDAANKNRLPIFEELIMSNIARQGNVRVISVDEVNTLLALDKAKSDMGCDDASCVAEIGQALGAQYLLTGTFELVSGGLMISVKLIDTIGVQVVDRAVLQCHDTPASYESCVKTLLGKIPFLSKDNRVVINTMPTGATIWLNGQAQGVSPLTLALPSGDYELVAILENQQGRTTWRWHYKQ